MILKIFHQLRTLTSRFFRLVSWFIQKIRRLIGPVWRRVYKQQARLRHRIAVRYHLPFLERWFWYARWHGWRWGKFTHTHVHGIVAASYIFVVVVVALNIIGPASALSTWMQSDWSGGAGSSTTNQFSSASNVVTATPGEISLARDNRQANGGFESDLSGWTANYDPSPMASLKAWFKADSVTGTSDGTTIATWNDSSTSANHATQATANARPTYKTNIINGRPVIRFDGSTDYMGSNYIPPTAAASRTVMTVTANHAQNAAWQYRYVYHYGLGVPGQAYGLTNVLAGTAVFGNGYWNAELVSSQATTGTHLITQVYNGTTDLMYAGGTQIGSRAGVLATGSGALRFGGQVGTPSGHAGFDIAEMLIFNTALSTNEQRAVETYLSRKYNLTIANSYDVVTRDTTTKYGSSAASAKITNPLTTARYTQSLNVGDTDTYGVEAYAYTGGGAVSSTDVQLHFDGNPITTSFTAVGGGWFRLTGTVTGANAAKDYGVEVYSGKTVYVDNFSVYKYQASGSVTSNVFDLGFGGDWGTLLYTSSGTGTTSVKVRTSNNADMSGAPAFAGCGAIASSTDLTGQSCVTDNHRYAQYQVTLAPTGLSTPVFEDIAVNYTPWDTTPPTTNASNISMKKAVGGASVSSNAWTNGEKPFFEWTAGADNGGGEGMKGYCLYLGTDASGNPALSKGILGNSPVDTGGACQFAVSTTNIDLDTIGYLGTPLTTSNSPYYLNIKAVDAVNNVFSGSSAQFQFRFDNTPPTNPAYITAPSQFVASKAVTLTWPTAGGDAAGDANSGLVGLQYKIGDSTWYGDSHNGNQDATDLLANDGSYTTVDPPDFDNISEGNNVVYFRALDGAGNASPTYVTTVIKLNTSAPSGPQNVQASPSSNTSNSFAFSWAAPNSFTGPANELTYCYTVNTLPTDETCIWTNQGVTSLAASAFATQPGANTFYVVAKDSNVNYATAASTTFTANTSAPGMPLNAEIADVSSKATSSWKLAVSWDEPTSQGAGVASYRLYRSTDNNNFTQIASTGGTSYVDAGLSQQRYYYKIRACDSANNCGAYSSGVNDIPTGRFTTPPELISQPSVTVSTRSASIRWVTDRESDSRIQYGTSSGNYFVTEAAASEQTKDHEINLSNLDAGTTYYYRARWTDGDGNIGTSSELSFTTLPAPLIKDVKVERVTMTSAIVKFTSKDATQVRFLYGKNDAFGGLKVVNTSLSESTYIVELTGLDDGTTYYFGLNPVDSDGNEYKISRADSFNTPPRPRISEISLQPLADEPTSSQVISWRTNVPASSLLRYVPEGGSAREISEPGLRTEHKITVRGLLDDTKYSFVAESRDADGNLAVSDTQNLRTALDTRVPKISDIMVEPSIRGTGAEARGQIIVSWKTDEPATSQVAFGEGTLSTVLNSRTSEDMTLTTDHIVIISDLAPSKVYSVQPVSSDKSRNSGIGSVQTAIIGRASDSVITVVLGTLRKIFGF